MHEIYGLSKETTFVLTPKSALKMAAMLSKASLPSNKEVSEAKVVSFDNCINDYNQSPLLQIYGLGT